MSVETANTLAGLNEAWPVNGDQIPEGDDHIRLIKEALKKTFPGRGRPDKTLVVLTSNYTLTANDNGAVFLVTGATTVWLPALSGLPAFSATFISGTAFTLAGYGTDQILGVVARNIPAGRSVTVYNNGASWDGTISARIGQPTEADNLSPQGTAGQILTSNGPGYKPTMQEFAAFGGNRLGGSNDWNGADRTQPGPGKWLTLGNAPNGPGPNIHYYPLCFEYHSKDGYGDVTQIAVPYGDAGNTSWFARGRSAGVWTPWKKILSEVDLPASGVLTFNGRAGAVALDALDVKNACGYVPANPANVAPVSHTHSYAPMTAVVSIVKYQDATYRYIRYTRANGAVVDVPWVNIGE